MSRKIILTIILFFSLFSHYLLFASEADADAITIKVQAVNPLDKEAVTPVRAYLPRPAGPGDIIGYSKEWIVNSEKLITKFDEARGQYYVECEATLAPREIKILEVTVKDVWVIDEERIQRITYSVERIADSKNLNAKRYPLVAELKEEILKSLDRIAKRQEENTVSLVGVKRHIEAYEENVAALEQVEADLGMLRNLVGK